MHQHRPDDMRLVKDEIFGPLAPIFTFEDEAQVVDIANSSQVGLASYIFTQDVNNVFRAQQDLDTGIMYVNAGTTGAEIHLPFGGTKATGNGHREAGTAAIDFYTEWQSVYIDFSGKLQRAQIDPVG